MAKLLASLVSLCLLAGTAIARPPPPYEYPEVSSSTRPTLIEWSSWVRLGVAVAHGDAPSTIARTTTEPIREADRRFAGALGLDVTLPIGSWARIGAWAEMRGWELPVAGGELLFIPGDLDMFFYKGKSALVLRAGGNPDLWTGQVGFHYRAPWDLFRERTPRGSSYTIGVGIVATGTQSRLDPEDWAVTVGLEFEPIGALRYVLGIRSWY
ncbi:MAG: hypothetical protein ACKV2T_01630 [Kofleriaceae bacterium]